MITLTKEWLHQTIAELEEERDAVPGVVNEDAAMALAAMKLALASLESEPVAWLLSGGGAKNNVSFDSGNAYADPLREVTPLYTAPPAPVSVPDDVLKGLLPDAEKAEFWFEHNGIILFEGVKFNNAVFDACRAAMLQGADGNSPVIPDGWVACSERMPDIGTEIFYFCQDDGLRDCGIVSSSNFSGKGDAQLYVHAEGYDLRFGVDITHWMPMPAAPQQE
ncbi:DUF551 domain-containing protein [Enterobacter hormaechei]